MASGMVAAEGAWFPDVFASVKVFGSDKLVSHASPVKLAFPCYVDSIVR